MGVFWTEPPKSAAGNKGGSLVDELQAWRGQLEDSIRASEAESSPAALELGIRKVATATLNLMRAMNWNPDDGMSRMFLQDHSSPEQWAKALKPDVADESPKTYLQWWRASQQRILEESGLALIAARQDPTSRVTESVEALVMESFAACVIALRGVNKPWRKILAAK